MKRHDWHWTDESIAGGKVRRTIVSYLNYKNRTGEWAKCSPRLRQANEGDTFFGYELKRVGDAGALNFFVGRPNALGGRPWWGIRKSDSELDKGVIFFVENGTDSDNPAFDAIKRKVTFPTILPNTDLHLYSNTHFLEKWIELKTPTSGEGGTGNRVDIGIMLPANWTLEVVNDNVDGNYLRILNEQGDEKYRSRPARAVDSSILGENGGPREVPCRFNKLADGNLDGKKYYRVRVRCTSAGFTYPIFMDPTIQIGPNSSLIEDTFLGAGIPNNNQGGSATLTGPATGAFRNTLMRVGSSLIPAGVINSVSCNVYTTTYVDSGTISAYAMTNAATWVEGTAVNAVQNGSSCWNKMIYPGTNWPGSVGAATSGIDFEADATPPSVAINALNTWFAIPLKPQWFFDWKHSSRVNNGWTLRYTSIPVSAIYLASQEYATDTTKRWYLTLDYTPFDDVEDYLVETVSEEAPTFSVQNSGIYKSRS